MTITVLLDTLQSASLHIIVPTGSICCHVYKNGRLDLRVAKS